MAGHSAKKKREKQKVNECANGSRTYRGQGNVKARMASYMSGGRQKVRWNGAVSAFLDRLHGVVAFVLFVIKKSTVVLLLHHVYFRLILNI